MSILGLGKVINNHHGGWGQTGRTIPVCSGNDGIEDADVEQGNVT